MCKPTAIIQQIACSVVVKLLDLDPQGPLFFHDALLAFLDLSDAFCSVVPHQFNQESIWYYVQYV